ncbi:hypothetical protein H0H81_002395 [Sphagnurus paluster]|uniref:Pentatricopeptide repeat-containing protein n=1 Tax=Sphagnurus paluster TaxID=117069 RepID=A0A9P7GJL3_9AGAR|nr:hypothetical protein H0H81_002395 [Sphagnurus paluster]
MVSTPRTLTPRLYSSSPRKPKPKPKPNYNANHPKSESDKLKDLCTNLNTLLRKDPVPPPAFVDQYIHRRLDRLLASATKPDTIYTALISQLLGHGRTKDAAGVYQRMLRAGLVPCSETQAQMLAVALAGMARADSGSDRDTEIRTALDAALQDRKYTDAHFLHILETMGGLQVPHEHILHVARVFTDVDAGGRLPSTALLTKLVEIEARMGRVDDALGRVLRLGPEWKDPAPYAAIMTALEDVDVHALLANSSSSQPPSSQPPSSNPDPDPADAKEAALDRILQAMQVQHVVPDIAVFNALIARALRRRERATAFAVYDVARGAGLRPTGGTFAPLFKVLAQETPAARRARRRRARVQALVLVLDGASANANANATSGAANDNDNGTSNKPIHTPRTLFHALLASYPDPVPMHDPLPASSSRLRPDSDPTPHTRATEPNDPDSDSDDPAPPPPPPPTTPSIALLTLALRAHVQTRDYAGAHVVLGAFRVYACEPGAAAFRAVLGHVVRRVLGEARYVRDPDPDAEGEGEGEGEGGADGEGEGEGGDAVGAGGGAGSWGARFIGSKRELRKLRGADEVQLARRVLDAARQAEFSLSGYLFAHEHERLREGRGGAVARSEDGNNEKADMDLDMDGVAHVDKETDKETETDRQGDTDAEHANEPEHKKLLVPSIPMIFHDAPPPSPSPHRAHPRFSLVPLLRLLRRAVYAAGPAAGDGDGGGDGDARGVYAEIARAKREMVPVGMPRARKRVRGAERRGWAGVGVGVGVGTKKGKGKKRKGKAGEGSASV